MSVRVSNGASELDLVGAQERIGSQDGKPFNLSLGHQQAIEGIAMMRR